MSSSKYKGHPKGLRKVSVNRNGKKTLENRVTGSNNQTSQKVDPPIFNQRKHLKNSLLDASCGFNPNLFPDDVDGNTVPQEQKVQWKQLENWEKQDYPKSNSREDLYNYFGVNPHDSTKEELKANIDRKRRMWHARSNGHKGAEQATKVKDFIREAEQLLLKGEDPSTG